MKNIKKIANEILKFCSDTLSRIEAREYSKEVMNVATFEQKKVLKDMQEGSEWLLLDIIRRLSKKDGLDPRVIDNAMQISINTVDGDESQLEDELINYGKKKGWFRGFEN